MNAKRSNVGSVFLMLLAAAAVGPKALAAAFLSVGIAFLCGAMLTLLRGDTGHDPAVALARRAGAVLAAPFGLVFVALWSETVGFSFLAGLATWTLIIAGSVAWTRTTAWRERLRETLVRPRLSLSVC